MKSKYIFKTVAAMASVGMLTACSSDYLDVRPESTVSTEEMTETVEAAALAINGLCNAMQTQYQGTAYNQYNGESYINTICNDSYSQDVQVGLGMSMWGSEIVKMGAPWDKANYVLNFLPWDYCYNLISQANSILDGIDNAAGDENRRNFIKAQALTFRAYGYTKLLMFYAPRWEDSRNGEYKCAVLRTKGGIEMVPLCTMNDVLALIYSDLDTAIELYSSCGLDREYKWQPNLSIAQGTYARAALIKHDWAKAQQMAHDARQGYSVMDNNTYLSGFCYDNNDFMWEYATDESSIYYWSWGSHFAVNGIYVNNWGEGASAIDYMLYKQLDPNDIRRQCFLTPDKVAILQEYNRGWNPGKIKDEDWWNEGLVNSSHLCDLSTGPFQRVDALEDGRWGLYNVAIRYCQYYGLEVFKGNINDMNNNGFMAYYTAGVDGDVTLSQGVKGKLSCIPFGAQFKFWSIPPYGVSTYSMMRAGEMCLAEAEAAYHNGDEATALKCLKEINNMRIPGYTCDKTGNALLDEIRLCRRIELWGEGQSWSDFKRWNLPINRVAWEAGNVNSGNWQPDFAGEIPADAHKGWRMLIPESEYEFNTAIDRNELEN